MAFSKHLFLILACLFLLPVSQAAAQTPTYKVFNDTNVVLNFQTLDPARGTWKDQSLDPHQQKTFNMMSGNPIGKIRIATPKNGYNEYKIGAGGVYRLTWSQQKQMWDIRANKHGYGSGANPAQPPAVAANPASPGSAHSRSAPQTAALPYRLGDSVLVLWNRKWYAATVIQLGGRNVRIHYDGYGSNYDEWVDGSRIRYR